VLGRKKEKLNYDAQEVKSILAEGLKIEGMIKAEGKIRVDGTVVGDVYGDFIVFGKSASVKGNVFAKRVVLMGKVEGDVEAEVLELKSSAQLKGNASVKEFLVEKGASLSGSVKSGSFFEGSQEVQSSKKE
jgi:cytoskeletal protein CcmA (bactofilin family)